MELKTEELRSLESLLDDLVTAENITEDTRTIVTSISNGAKIGKYF